MKIIRLAQIALLVGAFSALLRFGNSGEVDCANLAGINLIIAILLEKGK